MLRRRLDDDEDTRGLELFLIGAVVLLISLFTAWTEIRYLLFGETAKAALEEADIVELRGRRGRVTRQLFVSYRFTEPNGTPRHEQDRASEHFELPDDGTVMIQFIPGDEGESRMVGNGRQWSLFVVAGAFALAGWLIWKLIREANSPIPSSRRSVGAKRGTGR